MPITSDIHHPVTRQQAEFARHVAGNPELFAHRNPAIYGHAWARLKEARGQTIHRDRLQPGYIKGPAQDALIIPNEGDNFRHIGSAIANLMTAAALQRMRDRIAHHQNSDQGGAA